MHISFLEENRELFVPWEVGSFNINTEVYRVIQEDWEPYIQPSMQYGSLLYLMREIYLCLSLSHFNRQMKQMIIIIYGALTVCTHGWGHRNPVSSVLIVSLQNFVDSLVCSCIEDRGSYSKLYTNTNFQSAKLQIFLASPITQKYSVPFHTIASTAHALNNFESRLFNLKYICITYSMIHSMAREMWTSMASGPPLSWNF